ncbi:MAG: preprotein translocase subunit SecG [Thermoleophilia bacterium]|nr:preprotein translocase subunit SecG [Thermoleophilia bacterium]
MLEGTAIFFHVLFSILVVVLVLMHDGRDAGLGSLGGQSGAQTGQHVMDRNLDRITVVAAVLYGFTTLALHNLFT